jgi:hypothetical protein
MQSLSGNFLFHQVWILQAMNIVTSLSSAAGQWEGLQKQASARLNAFAART